MKRTGQLFESITSFDNLYRAFKRAFRASGKSPEACRFHFNLEKELVKLQEEFHNGTYSPSRYRYFTIYDPKERVISVSPFRDRVVHHAVVGVIEPVFEKTFIHDSYANRKGKGSHRAVSRAQSFLRRNLYFLKTDISKYFESIDHDILFSLMRRKIKDENTLHLVGRIIRNSDASRCLAEGKGLPIGNLTSQFFANVYLSPLDHFLKEGLAVKYYVRYMDDMVIFHQSKDYLKGLLRTMEAYLKKGLALSLNPKATLINTRIHGLPFLGFRIFPNLIRIKGENLRRMRRRLKVRMNDFDHARITEDGLAMSARSMFNHLSFADSLSLRRAFLKKLDAYGN